jgi:hypothetical protein
MHKQKLEPLRGTAIHQDAGAALSHPRDPRRKKAAAEMIRRRLLALVAKPTIVKEGNNLDEGSDGPFVLF